MALSVDGSAPAANIAYALGPPDFAQRLDVHTEPRGRLVLFNLGLEMERFGHYLSKA